MLQRKFGQVFQIGGCGFDWAVAKSIPMGIPYFNTCSLDNEATAAATAAYSDTASVSLRQSASILIFYFQKSYKVEFPTCMKRNLIQIDTSVQRDAWSRLSGI